MLEGILLGLETAFSLKNLLLVVAGCLIDVFHRILDAGTVAKIPLAHKAHVNGVGVKG